MQIEKPAGPTAVRFKLAAPVLPRLVDALAVGDGVRAALLSCSDGHPMFVGRDVAGQVDRGHRHAWFLPSDDDADGVLDHVVVYAREGFDRDALRAIERLRRVWGYGGRDMKLALVGAGSAEDLGCLRREASRRGRSAQLGTARFWESLTPFVPPRHVKVRAGVVREAPHEQLAWLLGLHGFPPAGVEPLDARHLSHPRPSMTIEWDRFRRVRTSGGGSRGTASALGYRLVFDRPVDGPIALGYGAHQGLGQFVAIE